MRLLKFTNDPTINRLRWVMAGTILFCIINTIFGQPQSYWQHPETAIRFDGLSVNNPVNRSFDFFLSNGWQAYLFTCVFCAFGAFLIVSLLPRRLALIVIFSIIFAHYFMACSWLAVRWHMGFSGPSFYSIILGAAIVQAITPTLATINAHFIKRLRWVMIGIMMIDGINTLIGQPGSYWHRPETVREGNEFFKWFLIQGWWAYVGIEMAYFFGIFFLVSFLPKRAALVCIFYFTFVHFTGASNWFFYEWRMGLQTPVIYGMLLSVIIVLLAFPGQLKPKFNK